MPIDLTNKVVLITGASSGFGADAARLFAREGCKVVLAARRLDRLQMLAAEIQNERGEAFAVPVDVSQPAEIEVMGFNLARGVQFFTPLIITWVASRPWLGAEGGLGFGISIGAFFAL